VLAEDHTLVRQGIRALLEKANDITVVGEAENGEEAVELVKQRAPDVLVMDVSMPKLDGLQAMEQVLATTDATRVVMLSMYSDKALVRQALRIGASGYLLKGSVTEEFLLAIRAAQRGELYLSPAVSRSLMDEMLMQQIHAEALTSFEKLTPRERQILQAIAEGATNPDIAEELKLSVKTVEKHRANLMSKLGAHDLIGLLRVAIRHRLVILDDEAPPA
jgi:DNA-binding NarL/FixJ family response regulator